MKKNIPYLVLNSAALGTALLVIGGFAALSVWAVSGLGLMALKLDKSTPADHFLVPPATVLFR